ncbi:glycosyltransferase family 20-domain-containing protein [Sporodiniella umbellata]|nr:glycosyltransferase family 20-domain-containing protein [Sporodiniella umbellata]
MSSLAWSSEDITQAMNQVSNYLENRTEELSGNIRTMSAFPFDVSHKHSENPTHPRDYAHTEKVSKRSRSLRDLFPNKQILFFKEDLHAAHVLYTLAAFANLLCKRPELINRLVFIVLCSSKISPHELEAVPEIVRQINQLYGTSTFVPVHFYHQEIDRDELLAFMNASHIGLCLSESAAQEFRQLTHYSQKTVSIKDPSDIPRLTVSLQDALY